MKKKLLITTLSLALCVSMVQNPLKVYGKEITTTAENKREALNKIEVLDNKINNIEQELTVYPDCEDLFLNLQHLNEIKSAVMPALIEANVKESKTICTSIGTLVGPYNQMDLYRKIIDMLLNIENIRDYTVYGYYNIGSERERFVNNALSLVGKISYQWGGKPTEAGNYEELTALDCSGFIDWCYWTTYGEHNENYSSTMAITNNLEPISIDELLPGDLGTINDTGSSIGKINHVGIYLGKDSEGNMLWCHCNNYDNTVSIDSNYQFNYFYKLGSDTENK